MTMHPISLAWGHWRWKRQGWPANTDGSERPEPDIRDGGVGVGVPEQIETWLLDMPSFIRSILPPSVCRTPDYSDTIEK